jgi:hypothetical protein
MLLEARCSLRFATLEKRLLARQRVAIKVPTSHPRPISAAQMDVASTDTTMPRGYGGCLLSNVRCWHVADVKNRSMYVR